MTPEEVDISSEQNGFSDAIIKVGLAHFESNKIEIHGVKERIKFLIKQSQRGSKGGKASAKSRENKAIEANASASAQARVEANAQANASQSAQANTLTLALPLDQNTDIADAIPPKTKTGLPDRSNGQTGLHKAFISVFTARWEEEHGSVYPFKGGKDGKAVKELLKFVGNDPGRWKEVLDKYFAEKSKFFNGHTLTKLLSEIAQFVVKPVECKPLTDEEAAHFSGCESNGDPIYQPCNKLECTFETCVKARSN